MAAVVADLCWPVDPPLRGACTPYGPASRLRRFDRSQNGGALHLSDSVATISGIEFNGNGQMGAPGDDNQNGGGANFGCLALCL